MNRERWVEGEKLLGCPFCGDIPAVGFSHELGRWDIYEVECSKCLLTIESPTGFEGQAAKAAAIATWNTRAPAQNEGVGN